MRQGSSFLGLAQRLALLGIANSDDEVTRAQKVTLTLAAAVITVLAVIWVGTYGALGLAAAAARCTRTTSGVRVHSGTSASRRSR